MDITLLFFTHSHFLLFSDEYSNQITCYSLISIHNEQQINKLNQHRMNTNQQKNCTLMLKHTSECHSWFYLHFERKKRYQNVMNIKMLVISYKCAFTMNNQIRGKLDKINLTNCNAFLFWF